MRVIVAEEAGYCYGVERAIARAEKALSEGRVVYSLGPVIHNPIVVGELESKGLKVAEEIDDIPENAVVLIRSHGVPPSVNQRLKEKNAVIIDATCPYVRRAQVAAARLKEEGYQVVIVGEKDHPEVKGILGYAGEEAVIVEGEKDARRLKSAKKRGVVFQTTQSKEIIDVVAPYLMQRSYELKVFNTICAATSRRQEGARRIAGRVDVMFVVGGRNSGNTRRLFEISRQLNNRTYHIESAGEITAEMTAGAETAGVTAGASTPSYIIKQVVEKLEGINEG